MAMIETLATLEFQQWMSGLRDVRAHALILKRITRAQLGNLGDFKAVGGGVLELRLDHGPGYRVYLLKQGDVLIVLRCGGDKSTQDRDIARAQKLAANHTGA